MRHDDDDATPTRQPAPAPAATNGHAFAIANRFDIIAGNLTEFTITYQCIVGDGVNPGVDFAGTFTYDATQTPATNLAAAKTAISTQCTSLGFTVPTSNILIDMSLN